MDENTEARRLAGLVSSKTSSLRIVLTLREVGMCSPNRLSRLINMNRNTVYRALSELENLNLVENLTPDKPRWQVYGLTPTGETVAESLAAANPKQNKAEKTSPEAWRPGETAPGRSKRVARFEGNL